MLRLSRQFDLLSIIKFDSLKPIIFNPLVIGTFARLHGAWAFLETMNVGIPTVEEKEHRYLEQIATEEGWGNGDYFVERDVLNEKFQVGFRHSLRTLRSSFSIRSLRRS
jgi:hypothetical protein